MNATYMTSIATPSHTCYFVVWTAKDCAMVWVFPDTQYWRTVLKKAQDFFHKVSLPEIVSCCYTGQASTKTPNSVAAISHKKSRNTGTWQQKKTGGGAEDLDDMVACDNDSCAIQWFHLSCVGLKQAPSESEPWRCTSCTNIGAQVCFCTLVN